MKNQTGMSPAYSGLDDNGATQFLLSVANCFRTKSIQKEAEKRVSALAETE